MSALILVGGATGNVGLQCCKRLSAGGHRLRVLVRDGSSAKATELAALPGVEVVVGDYGDLPRVANAFEGVAGALLACANVPNQVELETNFIAAAEASPSCVYLVKLSTCGAEGYSALDSAIEHGRFHAAVEERLAQCAEGSLRWTCLQPNCYFQNHLGDVYGSIPAAGIVAYPHINAGAAIVDARDVGDIAAALLADVNGSAAAHHAKKLAVCGPESWSSTSLAAMYTEVLNKPVNAVLVEPAELKAALERAGFPEWLAAGVMLTHSEFWARGKLDYQSSPEVAALLSGPPRTLREWVRECA